MNIWRVIIILLINNLKRLLTFFESRESFHQRFKGVERWLWRFLHRPSSPCRQSYLFIAFFLCEANLELLNVVLRLLIHSERTPSYQRTLSANSFFLANVDHHALNFTAHFGKQILVSRFCIICLFWDVGEWIDGVLTLIVVWRWLSCEIHDICIHKLAYCCDNRPCDISLRMLMISSLHILHLKFWFLIYDDRPLSNIHWLLQF